MTVFWIVAACLSLAALLFIVPPLFQRRPADEIERAGLNVAVYKNQLSELEDDLANGDISDEHYEKSRIEIERRLLEDTSVVDSTAKEGGRGFHLGTAAVLVLAVPLASVLIYNDLGTVDAVDPAKVAEAQQVSPHGEGEMDMAVQIEAMVGQLAQRLQNDPSDIEGWVMLGRSLSVLGRYDDAVRAYEQAITFVGEDPAVLIDYADALAMINGGNNSLEGRPMELLDKALKINPNNQKGLWLMGTALLERGDFAGAISHWSHLKSLLPPGSEDVSIIQGNIDEAHGYKKRQDAGEFGKAPEAKLLNVAAAPAAGGHSVTGVVTLSAGLQDKLGPNDTLFVFAKAVSGPQMPLAIAKVQASQLPYEFVLDESSAMMPNMTIGRYTEVAVAARISKSGDALPKSGDFESRVMNVPVSSAGVRLVIDQVVP